MGREYRSKQRRHERHSGWLLLLAALTVVVTMAFTIIYTRHVVANSERRDCDSIAADIRVYQETPPATPTGLNQWASKARRYAEMGCAPALPGPSRSVA